MAERQPTMKETLANHEERLSAAEDDIKGMRQEVQDVRAAVEELTNNTAKMVELAETFLPWFKNILYFMALVGANALLGGDTSALEKLLTLAQTFGG